MNYQDLAFKVLIVIGLVYLLEKLLNALSVKSPKWPVVKNIILIVALVLGGIWIFTSHVILLK